MKIQQLRYFIEVCNCGTITEAAANLYISQPSITTGIKDLEEEFGLNLFHRINKKLFLTKEGEFLLNRAIPLINDVDTLLDEMKDLSQNKNFIRLGLPLQVGVSFLPVILGEFRKLNPEIKIDIIELGSFDVIELLEREEIDLAIMSYENDIENKFDFHFLFDSEFVLCVNKSHHLASKSTIQIEEVQDIPLVMFNKGFLVNQKIMKAFSEKQLKPNVILYTGQLNTIKNLINNDIASAFLMKESINDEDISIKPILLKPTITTNIGIITKKNHKLYSDTKKLIRFLTQKYI